MSFEPAHHRPPHHRMNGSNLQIDFPLLSSHTEIFRMAPASAKKKKKLYFFITPTLCLFCMQRTEAHFIHPLNRSNVMCIELSFFIPQRQNLSADTCCSAKSNRFSLRGAWLVKRKFMTREFLFATVHSWEECFMAEEQPVSAVRLQLALCSYFK